MSALERRTSNVEPSERLIVALDVAALPEAVALARRLRGLARTVKVGSVLFTACGPEAVRRLLALGFEVMLDLKFFDIPTTVELSCRAATRLGVSRLTAHAAGEQPMLEAAVRGVREEAARMKLGPARRPKVLAVTVLTSSGPGAAGSGPRISRQVLERVKAAVRAGCDGVVASAEEARTIRKAVPNRSFEIVCPGIRPSWALRDDQRRIGTPAHALREGADRLVIGRPITAAPDPGTAAQRILEEMEEG